MSTTPHQDARLVTMDALDCIRGRRSVREYSGKKIGKEILERIVDAGRLAPTANNVQPWEFVVVTERDMLGELGSVANYGGFIRDAAACILVFCKDTKYYLEDGCAATENMLLAAESFGIGACWVAGDKKSYVETVRVLAGIPQGYKLVSMISLGYPKAGAPEKPKRKLGEVLHWEKF